MRGEMLILTILEILEMTIRIVLFIVQLFSLKKKKKEKLATSLKINSDVGSAVKQEGLL